MKSAYILFELLLILCIVFPSAAVAEDEPVKIASIFAKSGPAAGSNLHHIQAIRYAVDEVNKQGGVLGKRLKLLEFDNCSSSIQSKLAAQKAIKAGVIAVLGASWSDHSRAMAPVLQKAGVPMLSPDSTNPKVTKLGNYIFRACFIDSFQGRVLAKFAYRELKARTAVILQDITSSYSQDIASVFKAEFKKLGGRVVGEFDYKQTQQDFISILEQAKSLTPDVMFIPGHDESGRIVKQAQDMGIQAELLGGDGWSYRDFMTQGGQELKKGYFTTHWSKDVDSPQSREFVRNFQKIYEINEFSAVSYDAVMLLIDAIKHAGTLDRAKIRDALAATKNFEGVTGKISLDENGDPEKTAVVIEITNGKTVFHSLINP